MVPCPVVAARSFLVPKNVVGHHISPSMLVCLKKPDVNRHIYLLTAWSRIFLENLTIF